MAGTKLTPEKITSPMQLMAAWFSMLVLLEGVLLTAASQISSPSWATGYLVIFSSIVVLVVLGCVTLMLTKFRPHLQDGREYAQWLKDRNAYSPGTLKTSEILLPKPQRRPRATPGAKNITAVNSPSVNDKAFLINLTHADGASDIATDLRKEGFVPEIYYGSSRGDFDEAVQRSESESIWVGIYVPAGAAVKAIKIALKTWPQLKYMELSNDGSQPPEEVHYQLYLGGSSETARQRNLKQWTHKEIMALSEDLSQEDFHKLIRAKY